MHRGRHRRALGALAAAALGVLPLAVDVPPAHAAPPPTFGGDFPDPVLVQDGATTYAYSTNIFPFGFTLNVPVASSPDLVNWTYLQDAFPTIGSWAQPGRTWAPHVQRYGSVWALYYTAWEKTTGRQCIGHAVASSPVGPFVDPHGVPLVCQVERGGSIDPTVFLGDTGPVLLWKSEDDVLGGNAILWSAPLSADGAALAGPATPILAASGAWHRRTIEGPAMMRTPAGLLLLYSGGPFGSADYAMGYARCTTPAGPCTDQTAGAPWASTANTGILGPGGSSVLERPGLGPVLAFHGWVGAVGYPNGSRAMYLQPLDVSSGSPWIPAIIPAGNRFLSDAPTSGFANIVLTYGGPGDVQLACDWDGNGTDTPGVFRGGAWLIRNSNTSGVADHSFRYGSSTDVPLCGDWDGDGDDTPGVFRRGVWYLRQSNTTGLADVAFGYGNATDTPVVGRWTGGATSVGVHRSGRFLLSTTLGASAANIVVAYGNVGDTPAVGDWNNDGIETIGVVRRGRWYLRNSNTSGTGELSFVFGNATDRPLAGDWDGAGGDGPGVTR